MRPIPMTRYVALPAFLLAGVLALTGCGARPAGSAAGSSSAATDPSPSASASTGSGLAMCPDHVVAGQDVKADMDGDGTADEVRFTEPAGSGCPGGLRVTFAPPVSTTDCPDDDKTENGVCAALTPVTTQTGFAPTSLRAVTVPGRAGQLVVARETHPRGGFQDHLYVLADATLAELTAAGHAPLPFITTDTPDAGIAVSARCVDGGIEVLRTTAARTTGLAPTVDVTATRYRIDGAELVAATTQQLASGLTPDAMAQRYPDLARHTVLTEGCGG